jgi:small subunit ribosomal protein S2
MSKTLIKDMLDNIVHIGNKSSFWSPKMREYIYATSSNVHIFDLNKSAVKVEEIKAELSELTKNGKTVLFVATKVQARETVSRVATELGQPFVSEKWVPGLLTNFRTIKRRISTYLRLLKDSETGALNVLSKKEQSSKLLELEKLTKAYKGLKDMKRLPDAVFVIDGKFEEQAVNEANKLNIPVYSLLNTNGDIDASTNFAPVNTNSFKSVKFVVEYIKEGMTPLKRSAAPRARKMTQRTDKKSAK